jgi:hypothetical protein
MQRNKQVAMGRKKFNMDPKKVSEKEATESIDFKTGLFSDGTPKVFFLVAIF